MTGNRIMPHPAALPESELLAACELTRTRRGGPGGQHRNKVETAVVITHLPTGVSAEANERRSQAENRKVAIQRLRVHLALAIRDSVDTSQTPSDLWRH
ncbi:MAG: peptide chain release factor family protein, partial [Planctomycetota bacterium]